MLLENNTALVTGAGRGLGRLTALALAGEGASVILLGRKKEELLSVMEEITGTGGNADILVCDLSDEEQIFSAGETTREDHRRTPPVGPADQAQGTIPPHRCPHARR